MKKVGPSCPEPDRGANGEKREEKEGLEEHFCEVDQKLRVLNPVSLQIITHDMTEDNFLFEMPYAELILPRPPHVQRDGAQ